MSSVRQFVPLLVDHAPLVVGDRRIEQLLRMSIARLNAGCALATSD
jgi:hypothetical protein